MLLGSTSETEPLATLVLSPRAIGDLSTQIASTVVREISRQTPKTSPWLTVEQAASYMGFSRDSLYKLTAAHAIPVRKKVGGQGLRFHRDELDAWMENQYPRLDRLA
jgi:excisionase family DNA binding protein